MKKPRIFLSHSKKDRLIVERIAADLRSAQTDVWYDEWEIPPGESLRARIFEDGIDGCDLFFGYLTPHSVDSYWCKRELDAAFVHEVESKGGRLALFVDSDDTRKQLSSDLRAVSIPVLHESDYEKPLRLLLSRAWMAFLHAARREERDANRLKVAQLEKENAELQLLLEKLRSSGSIDTEAVIQNFRAMTFTTDEKTVDLAYILLGLRNILASGTNADHIGYMMQQAGIPRAAWSKDEYWGTYKVSQVTGPLVLFGVLQVALSTGEAATERFYLTDLGKEVVRKLLAQGAA